MGLKGGLRTFVRAGVMAFLYGSYEYLADKYPFLFGLIFSHIPRIVFSLLVLLVSFFVAFRLIR